METGDAEKPRGGKLGENWVCIHMHHSSLSSPLPSPQIHQPRGPEGWHPWEGRAQAKAIQVPRGKSEPPLPAWKVMKHHTARGTMPWDSHPILLTLVSPMDPLPGAICKAPQEGPGGAMS